MPIYKDGSKYYFRTYYTDLYGVRQQYKSKRYETKKEAQEEEARFILAYKDNKPSNSYTIKDIYLLYYDFQKSQVRETTLNIYKKRFSYMKSIENIKVVDFNLTRFNHFKKEIENKNFSTTHKNNIIKFLKSLLMFGNKYYNLNTIALKITGFKDNEVKKEMQFFTYPEFKKFISVENDINYKCLFEVLYYLGLRIGELQALKWTDINFNKRELSINKSAVTKLKGKKNVLYPPKTKNSIRILPIPKSLLNDLKIMLEQKQRFTNFSNNWFVFGNIDVLPNTTITSRKDLNCKKAGVKKIRIHDFRHSCASLLISKQATPVLVAKYLGHSNVAMTLNTYSHLYNSELDTITKLLDNLEK